MNTKFWMPTLIGLILSIGTVQAFADGGWYYDEDSDSIISSYNGSPVTHSTSRSEDRAVEQSGTWYYDESSDNIVINVDGSRSNYVRTNPSIDVFEQDPNLAFLDQ